MAVFSLSRKLFTLWAPLVFVGVLQAAPMDLTSDLPSAGRSDLDHLIEKNGGVIPYPFENLVSLLDANTLGARASAFFPHGRSLQRFETDFNSPRVLLAHTENFTGMPELLKKAENLKDLLDRVPGGRTFLGYTPNANTVEVFSYNETLGRFEVQLIKNYGPGLTPRLEYASRALCFSCHQNEGPIFSQFPWDETEQNQAVAKRLEGVDTYALRPRNEFITAEGRKKLTVGFVEKAVDHAQQVLNFQKLWVSGCGEDPALGVECRKLILKLVLTDPRGSEKPKELLERLNSILRTTWPLENIWLGNSVLSNRNLDEFPPDRPLGKFTDPLTSRRGALVRYDSGALSKYLEQYGGIPAGSHLEILREIQGSPSLFSADDARIIQESVGGKDALLRLLDQPEFERFFAARPLNRRDFLYEVGRHAGQAAEDPWALREAKMAPPHLDSAPATLSALAPARDHRLAFFKQYCAQCHSGKEKNAFNFMNAANDEELYQNLTTNPKILERLEWSSLALEKQMPPVKSKAGVALRESGEAHRLDMVTFLKVNQGGPCERAFSSGFHN